MARPIAEALEFAVARLFAGDDAAKAKIRKLVLRAVSVRAHPDGLARAMELRIPGCCIFCEEPVQGLRVTCASGDCQQAYQRAYHRDMRHSRGAPPRPRGPRARA